MAASAPIRAAGWALLAVACAGLVSCTGKSSSPDDPVAIQVNTGTCGPKWSAHGGERTLQIKNAGTVTTEVDLIAPDTGGVYAEVEALAPNTTRSMRLTLGRGTYALRCYAEDTDGVTGPVVTVSDGPVHGAAAVKPVDNQTLLASVKDYRTRVTAGLGQLATDVDTLRQALRGGDLATSRAAWLTAHLGYERLGAAYDTFDDFADKIDGMPDGLPGGAHDPDFTGLRRIEYGLWHGEPLGSLATVADQLATDVAGLIKAFPQQQVDPNDLPLRAHEIMENALQFELTGEADQGSHTGMATIDANLTGTQMVLDTITPVMKTRYADWDKVALWMSRTRTAVDSTRRPDGTWTPVSALDRAQREQLDGDIGQLLETLAPVAAIGDVRRTS
ncbi:EfeM/EfeO family lipoprotein [Rugosimonospora africana]|uniref:Iron transporter n=1 Tax=Rugosimonospora africana TaxID=556532 RepID=A0A8J3QNA4_9ACTN|nr:EfeM/EfeO family lipoprotein [Rugosimonospora africana]GIH14190.1 iron transporter [Rugosimonospora africana]